MLRLKRAERATHCAPSASTTQNERPGADPAWQEDHDTRGDPGLARLRSVTSTAVYHGAGAKQVLPSKAWFSCSDRGGVR
jgi:hypothetical protein